jgi:hypothetical protein
VIWFEGPAEVDTYFPVAGFGANVTTADAMEVRLIRQVMVAATSPKTLRGVFTGALLEQVSPLDLPHRPSSRRSSIKLRRGPRLSILRAQ